MEPLRTGAAQPTPKPACPPARHFTNRGGDKFVRHVSRGIVTYQCADCGQQFDVDSSG